MRAARILAQEAKAAPFTERFVRVRDNTSRHAAWPPYGPNFVVVGLGNSGSQYDGTRHNVGRDVIHNLAAHLGVSLTNATGGANYTDPIPGPRWGLTVGGPVARSGSVLRPGGKEPLTLGGHAPEAVSVTLATLDSFMNLSGTPTRRLLDHLGLAPANLILVHDDLDLDVGVIKLKNGGSASGQRGVESVIDSLRRYNGIPRIRIGISKPLHITETADYVLRKFTPEDHEQLGGRITPSSLLVARVKRAIFNICVEGVHFAADTEVKRRPWSTFSVVTKRAGGD